MQAAAGPVRHETSDASGTERIAAELAAGLRPGDVVLLSGELGAGKTTFVRGACRALGVTGRVASPTFTIASRHAGDRAPVSHLDLHRLQGSVGEDPELLADEFGPDRITFVEWPDAAPESLAAERIAARVLIEHLGGDRRAVTVEGGDRR